MTEPSSESSTNEPKYRGVSKRKWGRWVSEIRLPNSRERIWLGSYNSPEKAARAFDAAAFCLRGSSANFNFPDQTPNIPEGRSLSPSGIQAAAAHFANSVPEVVVPMETHTSTSPNSVVLHNNNYNEMGYDIFSGFDDYFLPPSSDLSPCFPDYDEENASYGDIFLWNF